MTRYREVLEIDESEVCDCEECRLFGDWWPERRITQITPKEEYL